MIDWVFYVRVRCKMTDELLADVNFVALDLETTGLDPCFDRIVEVGAVQFSLSQRAIRTFHSLVHPERGIPRTMTRIHGITNEMVWGKPTAAEVLPELLEFIEHRTTVVVAHHARFDLLFLEFAMQRAGCRSLDSRVIDTLTLVRAQLPSLPSYSLGAISSHLHLASATSHRALPDAETTMQMFLSILSRFDSVTTLSELFRITAPLHFSASAE